MKAFKVLREGGVRINGRYFPKDAIVTGDSLVEAFVRYPGGLLRRNKRRLDKVKALLEQLEQSGAITIEDVEG